MSRMWLIFVLKLIMRIIMESKSFSFNAEHVFCCVARRLNQLDPSHNWLLKNHIYV